MPIATVERETADAQDSITLFFHKNKDKYDAPSAKVFSCGLDEIKACIVELEVKLKSEDPEEVAKDEIAVKIKQEKLAKVKKDISILEAFYKNTNN
ncbi:hypothetical protein EW146_g5567 [Bondarzewia mesenterica]|uniref:Uncharacterized protein n=1 Tax=Bondarzewia mesenterica TaxID=1095465 RepID=A0A4S4LR58_9AGAM|nr:hypothetical protein EW146_g5567 [Bondarzewia mesenterica]